tara:strand:- start:6627 stop:7436 length:810 start_codon:yes stop_codon:yes gene_type:complete
LKLFDDFGRRLPSKDDRVFNDKPSFYYKLNQPKIDYNLILQKAKKYNLCSKDLSLSTFESKAKTLLKQLKKNNDYAQITSGVHIPFIYHNSNENTDIGANLEDQILPALKDSFTEKFPDAHFKAVLQSDSVLRNNVSVSPDSGYGVFLKESTKGVIGWYFPQVFQEFDIDSQRSQLIKLPEISDIKICLSGGMDIGAAVISTPDLLIDKNNYTPILCMSGLMHSDERLILILKAYGPHMEFWCMTQMLSKHTTQVSEQWAGGLTFYSNF